MSELILQNVLDETIGTYRSYRKQTDDAMAQLSDEEFFTQIDAESNSVAIIAKHIGGNLRSRWSDFLTSDGEKSDRNRDSEFVSDEDTRESVTAFLNEGWDALFATLESLTTDDLGKTVTIRGEAHTVVKAVSRSIAHTASHVGQIIFLAKHLKSDKWETLSIPKNRSAGFNSFMDERKDHDPAASSYEANAKFRQMIDDDK